MKRLTITVGDRTYHPQPVGKDGKYPSERKSVKRIKTK